MRTDYYVPREILEHPALLIDALAAHDISVQLETAQRAEGRIDEHRFTMHLCAKRFRHNLIVLVHGLPQIDWPDSPASDSAIGEVLAQINGHFDRVHGIQARIAKALSQLNILPLESPLEDELSFVTANYGHRDEIRDVIELIRKRRLDVARAVDAQDFEAAARHNHESGRLLTALYDMCIREDLRAR